MDIIEKTKEYDQKLYSTIYSNPKRGSYEELKRQIILEQGENGILKNAIKIKTNQEGDLTVLAPTICEEILTNPQDVREDIYQELVDLIYISSQIGREKAPNMDSSFLVQTLRNHDLILTQDQKNIAVTDALSMPGAIFFMDQGSLKKYNLTNHGLHSFDIRYEILMNPNWRIEEKADLVYRFYNHDLDFHTALEDWKENIVNNSSFYSIHGFEAMHKEKLYEYQEHDFMKYYPLKDQRKNVMEEVRMCELLEQMRPLEKTNDSKDDLGYQKRKI